LALYGLEPTLESQEFHLGNGVVFPLRNEVGQIVDTSPTYMALAVHFGDFAQVYTLIKRIGRPGDTRRSEVKFKRWVQGGMAKIQKDRFVVRVVDPVRALLKYEEVAQYYPFFFYCLPYETYTVGDKGQVTYSVGSSKNMVLSAVPITPVIATERYGVDVAVGLNSLAPQAGLIVLNMCRWQKIKTADDANEVLGDWRDYLPNDHRDAFDATRDFELGRYTATKLFLPSSPEIVPAISA